jgi:uncharacterized protein (DUF1697 family)
MRETVFAAFVRNVMIGREGLHRDVLLDMFERAGATDPVSYISTGNVSFSAPPDGMGELTDAVEADLERLLGRPTPVFVRTLAALRELVDADPFADPPADPVRDRIVTLFRRRVPASLELPLAAPDGDFVVFGAGPAEVFSVVVDRPDRQPAAPGGYIERHAGEPVTSRAIGTIERIVAARSR